MITGMSGSGKSRAIAALEDIGYYCVDNLPPKMLQSFMDLCMQAQDKMDKIAVVVDARSRDIFGDISQPMSSFSAPDTNFSLLYLDCDDNVLVQRFKETRRKHPLMDDTLTSVEIAIAMERKILNKLHDNADYIIDTTSLSVNQLREKMIAMFLEDQNDAMLCNCLSFGFKFGLPKEADLVFDVRCLPNPFYVSELKGLTGLDQAVKDYVMQWEQAQNLIPRLYDLIDYLIPLYRTEGKTQLTIAIGCTGGKHRSVVFTELIREHLRQQNVRCAVTHRDIVKQKE